MAHAIDMTTGNAAVFVTGTPAWHKLGKVVVSAQTSAEAIKLAGLDWKVNKFPLFVEVAGQRVAIPDRYATVRDDTNAPLGVVGPLYTPLQNVEAFDWMDALVNEKLAMYETAGAIHDGKRVWMMARIPAELRVAGTDDVIKPYVLLTNGHDGTSAVRMVASSIRVVCQNTLNLALNEAGTSGLTIPHFGTIHKKIAVARENLGIVIDRVEAFQEEINVLAGVQLNGKQVDSYFRKVFKMEEPKVRVQDAGPLPVPTSAELDTLLDQMLNQHDDKAAIVTDLRAAVEVEESRKEKNQRELLEMLLCKFENANNSLPGIAGSAWAAVNAVTEYVDWDAKARSDDTRLASMWFGTGNGIKQAAYAEALQIAGVA